MTITSLPLSLIPFCVLSSLLVMITQRKHIIMTLLALEAMILNLIILMLLTSNLSTNFNLFLIMVLLTLGACEAALGLACLVMMTRNFGNDQISSSSLNQC
uniref:NADH-ubiquinone oxidoreductase chain 4L n=1 Tax=Lepidonotopodium sp. YZ-2018 TaxID=2153333 RepID=A0A343W686_9ANNE|nr:NADH dehydrogenase subunit 4L [Lepidonotopodium sp. YZ-2018]